MVSRAPRIPRQRVLPKLDILLINTQLITNRWLVPTVEILFSEQDAVLADLVFVRNAHWKEIVQGGQFVGGPGTV
ncbi:MAG: hypothetical protein ABR555_17905 [Pyrinomonadaceae bacterium]